ncbi:MAG: RNA polymerase sigma factor [Gammaproteobacteria bacterium]|nr:RNA polymerase sigma factor [Gammaproteobacteria bacterium]MDH5736043.1 RNA polymerase sigma factor [Gammaproteobacteria bacterium]
MTIFRFSCQDKQTAKQVKACRSRLYRLAFSWCHDAMLADDLTQETLSRAMQKLDQLKNEHALDAWLFAILNNQWREYLRKKRPSEDIDELVLSHDQTPEYWHNRQQIIDHIRNAISELPLSQRQVLTLVDLESMSYTGVSEVLDIPVGTVMSRLSRARKSLQEKLEGKEKKVSIARLRSIK